MHLRLVFSCLIATSLVLGCGAATSSSWRDAIPATGSVVVVNSLSEEAAIEVDGTVLTQVAPMSRKTLRIIQLGQRSLRASTKSGVELRTELIFSVEEPLQWVIGDAPQAVHEVGVLAITNTLNRVASLTLDGKTMGQVLDGSTLTLYDVEVGQRKLRVDTLDGATRLEATVDVKAGATTAFALQTPRATLAVTNDTSEPVGLKLRGRRSVVLLPNEMTRFDQLPAGSVDVVTKGQRSGMTHVKRVVLQADADNTLLLSETSCAARVANRTSAPLTLTQQTGDAASLNPNQSLTMNGLACGLVTLKAQGASLSSPLHATLTLEPGRIVQWDVVESAKTLTISNHMVQPVDVFVSEGWLQRLSVGETATFTLSERPQRFSATTADGQTSLFWDAPSQLETTQSWTLRSPTAAVQIENRQSEPISVFVDSKRLGRLQPNQSVTFSGIEVGVRVIEAVGLTTGTVRSRALKVTPNSDVAWVVVARSATVTIMNETEHSLTGVNHLAASVSALPAGTSQEVSVPVGRHQLELIEAAREQRYAVRVDLEDGQEWTWRVQPVFGAIDVVNETDEATRIDVRGGPTIEVPAGHTRRIEGLPLGLHTIKSFGLRSGTERRRVVVVPEANPGRFVVSAEPGQLVIDNDGAEPVSLHIDDRPYGRIEAGGRQGFGALPTGRVTLRFTGLRSGWTHQVEMSLAQGVAERVVVPSPLSTLQITNKRESPIDVVVGGDHLGSVDAHAEGSFAVASGPRIIEVRGRSGSKHQMHRLNFGPNEARHLVVIPPSCQLVVRSSADGPRRLFLNGQMLGTLSPGDEVTTDQLDAGNWTLDARDSEGTLTHRHRELVRAGATLTWDLR